MKEEILYHNPLASRLIFLLEILLGLILLKFSLWLFRQEIYPDIYAFAIPLLGLALLRTGFFDKQIHHVIHDPNSQEIVILRKGIWKSRTTKIPVYDLEIDLKRLNLKKRYVLLRMKIAFRSADKEIESIESGLFSWNNNRIERLYQNVKEIKSMKRVMRLY